MLVLPKTLLEFRRMFPTERACAEYVLSMRWPAISNPPAELSITHNFCSDHGAQCDVGQAR